MYTGSICEALLGDMGKGGFGKRGIWEKGDLTQNELGALTPNLNVELRMSI